METSNLKITGWQRFWSRWIPATKHDLEQLDKKHMATEEEVIAELQTVVTQLRKLGTDTKEHQGSIDTLKAKIVDLEAIIAKGGTIGPALIAIVKEVKDLTQVVDDNVPEIPAPPTV